MKLQEMRVGNYYHWEAEGKKYLFQIEQRDFAEDNYLNFQRVPLTEEWLLDFGFIYDEDEQGFIKNGFHLENRLDDIYAKNINKEDFGSWFINSYLLEIKFVHQLQNLFYCLCGIDLELNK